MGPTKGAMVYVMKKKYVNESLDCLPESNLFLFPKDGSFRIKLGMLRRDLEEKDNDLKSQKKVMVTGLGNI